MLKQNVRRQQGLSMIEALVSLLIISIGLLGIASLQISSIKQSSSAHWHSQAVWANYEMTDRISANSPNEFANYDGVDTDGSYAQDCSTGPCSPAAMITADAQDWKNQVSQLPDGRGVIKSKAPNTLDVTVMWLDPAGNKNCGALDSDRTCYTVTIRQ